MPLTDLFKFARKKEPIPSSPDPVERSWASDTFFGMNAGPWEAYNPDELIRQKGFKIYRRMLRDPQVKAVFSLVVDIIISRKWRFEPAGTTERDQRAVDMLTYQFEKVLKGTLLDLLKNILTSKAHGFSVIEKVYVTENFEGKPKWFIKAAKLRPYHTFTFRHDAQGNIIDLFQQQNATKKRLDPRKFVIHVTNADKDPIYGESDLRAAYRAFWEKENITKFWDVYLERLASGFLVATVGRQLLSNERADLEDALRNMSAMSSLILPKDVEVEMKHAPATDAFERGIINRNTEIAKAMLVPSLLGLSEQGRTGSFAQSKTQLSTFFLAIRREGDKLADTVNEQIIAELSKWNFGDEFEPPRFLFDPFADDEKRMIAEAWALAVEKGTVLNTENDELRTRRLLGYDERDEKDELVVKPVQEIPVDPNKTVPDPANTNGSGEPRGKTTKSPERKQI